MTKYVFCVLFLLAFSGFVLGQPGILNRKVKIENREGTIESVLEEISRKGGFFFVYNQDIPRNKKVRLQHSRQTVQQHLDEIFNKEIYCVEYGNKLLLKLKPKLPKYYSISGKVVDSRNGEPVPFATVIIPGSDPLIGAVSDDNGIFHINVPKGMDIIQFSCMGYESLQLDTEQPIPGKIDLTPITHEISEVIISDDNPPVKAESPVAISYISGERLEKNPGASIEYALQGNSSGIHVVRNSGMPGASFQVKIRGNHSLINSDPVYYLDGVPLQQTLINAVSPHDIVSMEILKDASSTALYGASAGNGVVLLHSRNGIKDKTRASLTYQIGMQQGRDVLELMGTEEFLEFFELVRPTGSDFDQMDSLYRKYDTDWMKLMFHPAKIEDCHFSVSGGNERSQYYLGAGYFNQASVIKELKFKRFSFKFNSQHQITPRWHLGHDLNFAHMRHEGLKEGCFLNDHNNPVRESLTKLPLSPPIDTMSNTRFPGYLPGTSANTNYQDITYLDEELTNNLRKNYAVFGNLTSRVDISRQISYESLFGYEVYYQDNLSCNRSKAATLPSAYNPVLENYYKVLDLAYHWQNWLHYNGTIAKDHKLQASIGFEIGQSENDWIPVEQSILSPETNPAGTSSAGSNAIRNLRYEVDFRHHAVQGSIKYIFKERYILNAALRREVVGFDSTNFVRKQFSDWYPSVALGWIFLDRKGSSNAGLLSLGKIRYAFGLAGNSPRLNYSFHARLMRDMAYTYSFSSAGIITNSAFQRQANDRFYWEKIAAHNLGIELGLFRNQLFVSTDFFRNHLHEGKKSGYASPMEYLGQLFGRNYFGRVQLPVAEVVNSGIETEIGYRKSGRLINWNLSLHLAHLRNKIININSDNYSFINKGSNDPITVNLPGETAGSFYGYKIERLFTEKDCPAPGEPVTNQPFIDIEGIRHYAQPDAYAGDNKFVDMNNDGVIDKNDKTIIGNPYPDFTFGMYANVQFKQFDLAMLWQGTYGNEIYNATKLWLYNPYATSNWSKDILDSYRSPQFDDSGEMINEGFTETDLHRFDYYAQNKNLRVSNFYIEDGSYIRLKNIQLGYTLDPELTSRIHIQKFRIFICAQNLFTFTNYSGLDPEVGGWGIDCGIYPQPRTWIAGVNIEL